VGSFFWAGSLVERTELVGGFFFCWSGHERAGDIEGIATNLAVGLNSLDVDRDAGLDGEKSASEVLSVYTRL